jgi:DNA invertase Pin-like site-specific DNA recombinase
MALIGYARVSTQEQNEGRQTEALEALGVDKLYIDKCSGKDAARPQLSALRGYVREGDTVVVTEYSRLARSVRDLLNIWDELNEKGVKLRSLKENIDTSSPRGEFMLTVFAGLAEFERKMILQRQSEGIKLAKNQGKYKGRQPLPFDEKLFRREVEIWKKGEQTARETMRHLDMKPNRFYRKVKELYGKEKGGQSSPSPVAKGG